jgi:hypothetical protein
VISDFQFYTLIKHNPHQRSGQGELGKGGWFLAFWFGPSCLSLYEISLEGEAEPLKLFKKIEGVFLWKHKDL